MTHEEKLKAVTDDIRVKLPRLMELEKGCLINRGYWIEEFLEIRRKEYVCLRIDGYSIYCYKEKPKKEEIIGKEPTILDCMEWLDKKEYKVELTGRGLFYAVIGKDHPMKKAISCRVDLSKPYLKDQSEELINFLYELL